MGAQNITVVSHKLLIDLKVYSYDCLKREFHNKDDGYHGDWVTS